MLRDELASCLQPTTHVDRAPYNHGVESVESCDLLERPRFCVDPTLRKACGYRLGDLTGRVMTGSCCDEHAHDESPRRHLGGDPLRPPWQ